jgi:8-oxo-dGTP pyrophosphatase MutT (NUDIX family)
MSPPRPRRRDWHLPKSIILHLLWLHAQHLWLKLREARFRWVDEAIDPLHPHIPKHVHRRWRLEEARKKLTQQLG